MTNLCVRLFIKGKVQGVFFRQALKVRAKKNNVNGWVRNLKD
ncbi:MAG: acylphosphatase, partial [Nitrosopumilaceae archaeon]